MVADNTVVLDRESGTKAWRRAGKSRKEAMRRFRKSRQGRLQREKLEREGDASCRQPLDRCILDRVGKVGVSNAS